VIESDTALEKRMENSPRRYTYEELAAELPESNLPCEKRDLYEQYGVKEYWLIDPEAQTVDVLHLVNGRYQLSSRSTPGQMATSQLLPGFNVAVAELLAKD
jgi:Uma2 family endonuclease